MQISTGTVYSLHKSSTRAHIEKTALTHLGAESAEVVAELNYDLPATFKHHKCGFLSTCPCTEYETCTSGRMPCFTYV